MKIFDTETPYSGKRKIIVSTSLAETSITVEDVVYVIDPGLAKGTAYSPHTNIASLETFQVSRSNVQQRRGRAGRCRPGTFFKLYSQYEYLCEMRDHELPEMLRTPVEELCLQVKSLRLPGDVSQVLEKAIDPPSPLAVENAVTLLSELGAFDAEEDMTPLGWSLSQLPVHPTLGKMLLLGSLFTRYGSQSSAKNKHNNLLPLISICSTLSFKSPFVLPFGKEKEADAARKRYGAGLYSDHLLFAKVADEYNCRKSAYGGFTKWLDENFLSKKTLEMTSKINRDLEQHLKDLKVNDTSDFVERDNGLRGSDKFMSRPLLSAILAASLGISFTSPDARASKKLCSLRGGVPCSIHPSSLLSAVEAAGNDRMLWKKYKHLLRGGCNDETVEEFVLDTPDKIFIVGWFERLKTSDVYLRDCTLFSDPLPLLLLLTGVTRRGGNPKEETVFEVKGGKSSHAGDAGSDTGGNEQPTLLLKVHDKTTAHLLSSLRMKLGAFFGAVFQGTYNKRNNLAEETYELCSRTWSLSLRNHLHCT